MKISYNWLREYIDIDFPVEQLSEILTDLGLEVSKIEDYCSIQGGLKGFVTGEVIECKKHPNADKLYITKVDIGQPELLDIVCGAPNVATGQKVVVATVGTMLYTNDGEFQIKKAKIRGESSQGMICAEDEMGVGDSHDGIMVLEDSVIPGTPASKYFNIENDIVFEIDLTPNRIDAASHIGVARDIAAWINQNKDFSYKKPDISKFENSKSDCNISVIIENSDACPRYMGLCINNIKVQDSPEWLKNKLNAIGVKPINNIVDITNFVLHETGQPLHAFDKEMIKGNKVIIKTLEKGTKFTTLDEVERELDDTDLMICNQQEGMCIAGVMGGIDSGITNKTKSVFLESAYFNPTWVRKTAKKHGISTDSSFRFERGADIDMLPFAIKRAALLIKEIAGGDICSELIDEYPKKINKRIIDFDYQKCFKAIGKDLGIDLTDKILEGLEIKIIDKTENRAKLEIPHYRVDVTRQADVNEEILRVYGYNNIEVPEKFTMNINKTQNPDKDLITNKVSDYLAGNGFIQIMCNSLIKDTYSKYAEEFEIKPVSLHNALSKDLEYMRFTLLFGGLESIAYNINRKNADLKFFEFGRIYSQNSENNSSDIKNYNESDRLGLWLTGDSQKASWNQEANQSDIFLLKAYCENLLNYFGLDISLLEFNTGNNSCFTHFINYKYKNNDLVIISKVSNSLLKEVDIEQDVFYAEFNFNLLIEIISNKKIEYIPSSKFPPVKRDLAILINNDITYEKLKDLAFKTERNYLKSVHLFDVYDGKGIPDGKISYALNYTLQDDKKTMTDKQIDSIMQRITKAYEKEFDAKLR